MVTNRIASLIERLGVVKYGQARIPTDTGEFDVAVYQDAKGVEHLAITKGEIRNAEDVLVRVHSECFTGEVLGSMKCDCREQLHMALAAIQTAGRGVVVYLRQEGRGIGLGNKIRAYELQNGGDDTVEANLHLGFPPDMRSYELAADILKSLGIGSIALMTNNPHKISGLEAAGIVVTRRVPLEVKPTPHNIAYLRTKRDRLGHLLTIKD